MTTHRQTAGAWRQQKQRSWVQTALRVGGGLLVLVVLLVVSYFAANAIALDPVTAYRMHTSGDSNIYTYTIFPQRAIAPSRRLLQVSLVRAE